MPLISYQKKADPDSIAFFERGVRDHSRVEELVDLGNQTYRVIRGDPLAPIDVYLTNYYILGEAQLDEILSEAPQVDAVVTISGYNSYSKQAKEMGRARSVGVFKYGEFMGALNYEGTVFVDYISPDRDKKRG